MQVTAEAVEGSAGRRGELVRQAMASAMAALEPPLAEMARFATGQRDAGGEPAAGRGKGLRPTLALLGAEAAGGMAEAALPGAVAVELVHTFTLVHDDIMDGDERRRHRPSLWKAYGTGPAVLVGDALLALALESLGRVPAAVRGEAVALLAGALLEVVVGQAADMAFEDRPWTGAGAVTLDEYHAMAAGKTGALLGCSAALGAVLAGAPRDVADGLARAGRELGLAFQAVDDVLGIWGDPDATGKPVFSDLRRRKKTAPVLVALSGPDRDALVAVMTGAVDERGLRAAAGLIERAGGRTAAEEMARRCLGTATALLRELPLARPAVEDLLALAEGLVARRR